MLRLDPVKKDHKQILKKKNLPGYKEAGNREDRTCLREPWYEVGELEKKDKEGLPESLHFICKVWA